jgi:thymidylate kinase
MLLAFEGIDCAGKGEITTKVAKELGALLYKTPPESMRAEQERVNETANDEDHYRYFVRVCQEASRELPHLLAQGPVVLDRYWITTVVYHRVMGVEAHLSDFGEILMPDFTVYLTVTPEVQAIRFAKRGMSSGDKRMDGRYPQLRTMYDLVLGNERAPVIHLDTSPYNSDESTALILGELEKLQLAR